eukprot:Rmarinus@m.30050
MMLYEDLSQPFWLLLRYFWVPLFVFMLPIAFGLSFGIRRVYVYLLEHVLQFASSLHQREIPEQNKNTEIEISEGSQISLQKKIRIVRSQQDLSKLSEEKYDFSLDDICYFIGDAAKGLVDDEITKKFFAEERANWNMLTRTGSEFSSLPLGSIPWKLIPLWFLGFIGRYVFMFPLRLVFAILAITFFMVSFTILYFMDPNSPLRKKLEEWCAVTTARMFALSWSAVITYHNRENRATKGSICTANHTSPIDCIVLAQDNVYSMIGQRHGGFIGLLQKTLSIAQTHVWFDRSEASDREAVCRKLRQHCSGENNHPVLIFPEGTCINNTSVMQFKKGSFEIDTTIYPVAIKYHPAFANCFWDSKQQSFFSHMVSLMSAWAVVADVWYLPPMRRKEGEHPISFANRVKSLIAKRGGLVDLQWDGALKRTTIKPEYLRRLQKEYSGKVLRLIDAELHGLRSQPGTRPHSPETDEQPAVSPDHVPPPSPTTVSSAGPRSGSPGRGSASTGSGREDSVGMFSGSVPPGTHPQTQTLRNGAGQCSMNGDALTGCSLDVSGSEAPNAVSPKPPRPPSTGQLASVPTT